jgi:hypothetical protein
MSKLCLCGCGQETPIITKSDKRRGWVKGEHLSYINGHFNEMLARGKSKVGPEAPIKLLALAAVTEITAEEVAMLRKASDLDAAETYDKRLRHLERQSKRTFVERGVILLEVEERSLWSKLTDEAGYYFTSMGSWLSEAAPYSRSDCYAALGAVKELRDVPTDELLKVPRCNTGTLQKLSSATRQQPEVIQAAQTMTEDQFISHIEATHPEQHVEHRRKMNLKPQASAFALINTAYEAAEWSYGVTGREQALESIVASWMDAPCEKEGYEHMSNRIAFEHSRMAAA